MDYLRAMPIYLNDYRCRKDLYPFTETRHTADIRVGILTIREKWEKLTGEKVITISEDLAENQPKESLSINANIIPSLSNYKEILDSVRRNKPTNVLENNYGIRYPWQINKHNEQAIKDDFTLLTRKRKSAKISSTNRVTKKSQVFLEKGVIMEHCIINAAGGPVYIGRNAHVMEGNMIRGAFALCEGSVLKMGSKIYSGTTIGPWCVVGGEVKNTVFFGYSNKAHDGYLGDSVIGEWCNLGAGTSNSNIKNSAGDITFQIQEEQVNAGNKAGVFMGDYSRSAINTSFNTGSMVGVCCNIFGREFPARSVASFTWGKDRYRFDKVLEDITNWKKLKDHAMTETEITMLNKIYITNK